MPSDNPPIPLAAFNERNDEEQRYDQRLLADQLAREEPLINANVEQSNIVDIVLNSVQGEHSFSKPDETTFDTN